MKIAQESKVRPAKEILSHIQTDTSFIKFDIEPEFWRELNKETAAEPASRPIEEIKKTPSKVVSIFKDALGGSKHF